MFATVCSTNFRRTRRVGDALSAVGALEVVGRMWARSEIGPKTMIPMKDKSLSDLHF